MFVARDFTVRFKNRFWQLTAQDEETTGARPGSRVVERRLSGELRFRHRDRYLAPEALGTTRPAAPAPKPAKTTAKPRPKPPKPGRDHPWRKHSARAPRRPSPSASAAPPAQPTPAPSDAAPRREHHARDGGSKSRPSRRRRRPPRRHPCPRRLPTTRSSLHAPRPSAPASPLGTASHLDRGDREAPVRPRPSRLPRSSLAKRPAIEASPFLDELAATAQPAPRRLASAPARAHCPRPPAGHFYFGQTPDISTSA